MADLTITAANVVTTSSNKRTGTAGATITAGQALYLDSTTNTLKLADTDASALAAACVGIALHGASSGQPITYQTAGDIVIGATVAVGEVYVLSGTAGGIAPVADLANGDYTCFIGIGKTATTITLGILAGGVAKA